jgi:predicted nuclease of predicted toxin-antitoxin system
VDSQLPRALATALRQRGHDAVHLADWHAGAYRNAADPDLLRLAVPEQRIIITFDLATLPRDAYQFLADGTPFAGVLVLTHSVGQTDIGAQLAAVLAELSRRSDWDNCVVYAQRQRA